MKINLLFITIVLLIEAGQTFCMEKSKTPSEIFAKYGTEATTEEYKALISMASQEPFFKGVIFRESLRQSHVGIACFYGVLSAEEIKQFLKLRLEEIKSLVDEKTKSTLAHHDLLFNDMKSILGRLQTQDPGIIVKIMSLEGELKKVFQGQKIVAEQLESLEKAQGSGSVIAPVVQRLNQIEELLKKAEARDIALSDRFMQQAKPTQEGMGLLMKKIDRMEELLKKEEDNRQALLGAFAGLRDEFTKSGRTTIERIDNLELEIKVLKEQQQPAPDADLKSMLLQIQQMLVRMEGAGQAQGGSGSIK